MKNKKKIYKNPLKIRKPTAPPSKQHKSEKDYDRRKLKKNLKRLLKDL